MVIGLLKLIPTPSLPVIALTAFLSGSAIAGYTSHVFHKAELAEELSDALIRQSQAVVQAYEENDRIRSLDQRFYEEELTKVKQIKEKTRTITKEIVKYVPEESNGMCNYSYGAVGLLNGARQPFNPNVQRMYQTADQPDRALEATSPHTQRREIEWHVQCAEQYNELAAKHDALIGWINENDK